MTQTIEARLGQSVATGIVDADGHLMESMEDLAQYVPPSIAEVCLRPRVFFRGPFPSLDGLHYFNPNTHRVMAGPQRVYASEHRPGSAQDWVALLDTVGIKQTVLYPSEALSVGLLRLNDYVVALCRGYNDYLADGFRRVDKRLHPVGILPFQSPKAAVEELRRAVKELDITTFMLPATGLSLDLGHEDYWPIYEAGAELGCVFGVHGGSNVGIGLDTFADLVPSHVLHHPYGLMRACVSMLYRGLFDRLPDLRVAFLEGGCAWTVMLLDRISRDQQFLGGLQGGFEQYLAGGQMLIGCEGEDASLPYLAQRVGIEPFAYSSDYPHEVDLKGAEHELEETLESGALSDAQKAAVLGSNAKRFFRL